MQVPANWIFQQQSGHKAVLILCATPTPSSPLYLYNGLTFFGAIFCALGLHAGAAAVPPYCV